MKARPVPASPAPRGTPAPPPAPWWRSADESALLYHGDCREILPRLAAAGLRPGLIFADPPYHLSNGGSTCRSGRRARVDKGGWDRSGGAADDHAFILAWLSACLASLETGGSIWVSGTHHAIFSIGYGLQELGAKILNTIVWEKPAPPPHLACRYYTHSHELILWARRSEKERHIFHYAFEKEANGGRQQKDVWRPRSDEGSPDSMPNHWRIAAPGKTEKAFGRHPTQKPIELLDRIVRCSSNPGDLVLDPFCGSGTTGLAALGLGRRFIGIDESEDYLALARDRLLACQPLQDPAQPHTRR